MATSCSPRAKGHIKLHVMTYTGYSKEAPRKEEKPLLFNVETDPGRTIRYRVRASGSGGGHPGEMEKHRVNFVPGKPQY